MEIALVEHRLRKPIVVHGREIAILEFRRPTWFDLIRVGNPVKIFPHTDPMQVEHDYPKVIAMVARLANVPSSSIEGMDTADLSALAWALTPMFYSWRVSRLMLIMRKWLRDIRRN